LFFSGRLIVTVAIPSLSSYFRVAYAMRVPSGRTAPALARVELEAREEVRDLGRRRLR
jgi:hypothetical protein